MKRSNKTTPSHQEKISQAIVSEPDDEKLSVYNPDLSVFGGPGFFSKFSEDITNFHNRFHQQFEEHFENLGKNIQNQKHGFHEVKSFSSHIEYKDGKVVKKNEKGIHYVNDNGKGFVKTIQKTPDGTNEIKKEFDNKLKIKN